MIVLVFMLWTFTLYCVHRAAHVVPGLRYFHLDHHQQVTDGTVRGWHWSNLLLFNDTWRSTVDLWLTEVIPTLVFCWAFDCWWLAAFYYVWAAFVQELIEHNPRFNWFPLLTSGKWHLVHHSNPNVNFGLFWPFWDYVFNTEQGYAGITELVHPQPGQSSGLQDHIQAHPLQKDGV